VVSQLGQVGTGGQDGVEASLVDGVDGRGVVFGEWGTGKTSLMRLIERMLVDNDDVVTVWFNAWRYEQEEHPIVPLVGTIVQALEQHQTLGKRVSESGQWLIRRSGE
jgi:predicted KAP-like P-loop ATPase